MEKKDKKCYVGTNYVRKTSVGIETGKKLVPLESVTTKLSASYLLVESLNHQQVKSYFLINTIFTMKLHGELYILCQLV